MNRIDKLFTGQAVLAWGRVLFSILAIAFGITLPLTLSAQTEIGDINLLVPTATAPLKVAVGIQVDQIVSIDQKAENFGAVITVRMIWEDKKLAFDATEFGEDYKLLSTNEFVDLAASVQTTTPFFIYQNQQAQRWKQEAFVVVRDSGEVRFMERSTLTMQAPYFDFRRYPFDSQRFFVEIVSIHPLDTVVYTSLDTQSSLGDLLGEEAWILENAEIQLSTEKGLSGAISSKVSLGFTGRRHIQYYALRIFLPLLVLVAVSWMSFFLDDYSKRIDIAGANLFVFVAFNFTISDSLPQLGYLTFLDFILQWMFLVTAAVIVINVGLKRMQIVGHEDIARTIDNNVIKWIFPLGYGAVVLFAVYSFLIE